MTHSLWPLFSNDLPLARQWLQERWDQGSLDPQLLHWGLGLGLAKELSDWMSLHRENLPITLERKLRFRLARLYQDPHPHLCLTADVAELKASAEALHHRLESGPLQLRIRLNGGIGDHLQDLSLIHWWCNQHDVTVLLETEPKRIQQLQALVQDHPKLQFIEANCRPADHPLTSLGFEGLVRLGPRPVAYPSWLKLQKADASEAKKLICCWRAQGSDDRFSCHSRSIAFADVACFYKRLQQLGVDTPIVDLTAWMPWEAQLLSAMGVRLHNPADGDVATLAKLIAGGQVVTIDTALAHLCAGFGQPAWVLLPLFADERWKELRKSQHCYGQALHFLEQSKYGCWQDPLSELLNQLT